MTTTARRFAEEPRDARIARIVVLIGTVLAIAAVFGPIWVVRAGVMVALVAGGIAWLAMWRTLRAEQRAAGARLLAESRAHGAALRAERQHGSEVLAAVSGRLSAARHAVAEAQIILARQQRELAESQHRLAAQRGDNAVLRARLARREGDITRLRADLTRLEAEARRANEAQVEAQRAAQARHPVDAGVVGMPRRKAAVRGPRDGGSVSPQPGSRALEA